MVDLFFLDVYMHIIIFYIYTIYIMKKTLFRVLSIALATTIGFSASSCGNDDPDSIPVEMTITIGDVTQTTVAATITPSKNAAKYSYAIGEQGDLDAFNNGTLAGIVNVTGDQPTTLTFTDLDEETDYVIFTNGINTAQQVGATATKTARTLDATTPGVKIKFDDISTVAAIITTKPNSLVSKYYTVSVGANVYESFVDALGGGDKIEFMETLVLFELASIHSATATEMWQLEGSPDFESVFVVLVFDQNGDPVELIEKEYKAPPFIDGLSEAGASITISNITASSAKIKITPDANALGFYAGIFTEEDYEDMIIDEEYLRQYVAMFGFFSLVEDDDVWDGMNASSDYVMVVSPFNRNGIQGYGPFVTEKFTTLAGSPAVNNTALKHKTVLKSEAGKKITRNELIGKKVK